MSTENEPVYKRVPARVQDILQRLSKVKVELEREQSANQGGRFEWIDSVLVTALQEGHWLLIDNVNFCR